MFNLTNPTMQAISGAGGNLGAGLGESLVHIAQQKALQRSLQGVTPETNPYEIIQKFAQNRVPSQLTEQFFSPVVQQRAAQQQAAQLINQAINDPNATPKSIATAYARASSLTGSTEGQRQALDLALGSVYGGGGGTGTGNTPSGNGATPGGKQVQTDQYQPQPALGNNGMTGVPQMGQTGLGTTQQAGIGGGERFTQIPSNVGVQRFTPEQKQNLRNQNYQKYGLTRGDVVTDRQIAENQLEFDNQIKELELQQTENTEARARQDEVRQVVEQNMQRDFGGNEFVNTNLGDFAKKRAIEIANSSKKSPDQIWNEVHNEMDRIINARDTLQNKLPDSKFIGSLDNPQKKERLKGLNVQTQAVLKQFPEGYKKAGYEMLTRDLRNKWGVGPVSAEYALNYPDSATIKRVNALPSHKLNPNVVTSGRTYTERSKQTTEELTKILTDVLPKGQSPLIIKDLVVNGLGYDDDVFDNALNQAEKIMMEKGLSIPDWLQQSRNDSKLRFNKNPLDVWGGQSLLKIGEIHR